MRKKLTTVLTQIYHLSLFQIFILNFWKVFLNKNFLQKYGPLSKRMSKLSGHFESLLALIHHCSCKTLPFNNYLKEENITFKTLVSFLAFAVLCATNSQKERVEFWGFSDNKSYLLSFLCWTRHWISKMELDSIKLFCLFFHWTLVI